MFNRIDKEIKKTDKALNKVLSKAPKENKLKKQMLDKVPDKLSETLQKAFCKAFELAFLKGTGLIEKTFDKEEIKVQHQVSDALLDYKKNRKNIKKVDKLSTSKSLLNNTVATTSGALLGFLGMGIPDIPVLVSVILKSVYEIALSYGYDYDTNIEKIYILKIISNGLSKSPEEVFYQDCIDLDLNDEIIKTSKILSDELLLEKFIQGIPVIGTAGALVNNIVVRKINKFAKLTYRKRYLMTKKRS